jgi:hypothetical protein
VTLFIFPKNLKGTSSLTISTFVFFSTKGWAGSSGVEGLVIGVVTPAKPGLLIVFVPLDELGLLTVFVPLDEPGLLIVFVPLGKLGLLTEFVPLDELGLLTEFVSSEALRLIIPPRRLLLFSFSFILINWFLVINKLMVIPLGVNNWANI